MLPIRRSCQSVEHGLLDDSAVHEMLDDDSLEQRRCDAGIPDSIRVHDDDRPAAADAEARRLAALHAVGSEEKAMALEESWQQPIELTAPAIRRAEAADTYENVSGVRIHSRKKIGRHAGWMNSGHRW